MMLRLDPLAYLRPAQRVVVGPVMSRFCTSESPWYVELVNKIGPRAAALSVCGQVLACYTCTITAVGLVLLVVLHQAPLAVALIPGAWFFGLWTVVVVMDRKRAERDFRDTNGTDESGSR
jgi:hypothetical protein